MSDAPSHSSEVVEGATAATADGSSNERSSADFLVRRQMSRGGAAGEYRALIIGRPGIGALLTYELVTLFSSWVPGALGLALRRLLYPILLGSCGSKPIIGQNVVLRHPHKIHLGDSVIVDDNCLLDAKGANNKGITLGDGVFLGRNTILSCKDGDIVLDDGVNIGFNSQISSGSHVRIGKDGLLASYCYLIGGGHESGDPGQPFQEQRVESHGVVLEDNVWLGAGVKVLDGVTIGADSMVGAGAVVLQDIPARSVAAGVPARVLRQR